MLANVARVVVSIGVAIGTGVLLYLDNRVLGTVITGLTVGLLVFGVIGAGVALAFAIRAVVRAMFAAPEPPSAPAEALRPQRASGRP
ncbi:hypothetical protein [Rhodoplanes serenus]|uniref:hypothetical protein n=1 Tax=Rhodoplanes serenus TaxID=200615 RepID=UPI000DADBA83|nr:hypothetical protein [Rhodoplanes serenus]RAI30342.1 hypothetical protein CH340_21860 [Rhodoplanes serenus]